MENNQNHVWYTNNQSELANKSQMFTRTLLPQYRELWHHCQLVHHSPCRPSSARFQKNMVSWMSSLISQQDGCMRMVAQQASMGRLQQKQLEQAVVMKAPRAPSPDRDQTQDLRDQLAHREVQLQHVRSERDTHLAQEEGLLAYTIGAENITYIKNWWEFVDVTQCNALHHLNCQEFI